MPSTLRLAAFEHCDGGKCVEEFVVEITYPRWLTRLPQWARDRCADRRVLHLAQHGQRLAHVQHLPPDGRDLFVVGMNRWAHKPLGSFVWWQLRVPDYKVDWPVTHTFIQIDRATGYLHTWSQAQEPILSTDENLVIDVTGTSWEHGWQRKVFGRFVLDGTSSQFVPDHIVGIRQPTPLQLTEAAASLDPSLLMHRDTAYAPVAQGVSL